MIRAHRERFNREFTEARYQSFVKKVESRCGADIHFRLSETPCFFAASLMNRLVDASRTLLHQLLDNSAYMTAANDEVPPPFRLTHAEKRPTFVCVDWGLVTGADGMTEGRLVELQAFPSLYGFQRMLGETCREHDGFPELSPYLGGLDTDGYTRLMRDVIVGPHDPREVVLMEIDPLQQKTLPDFIVTERDWGVRAVDLGAIQREGAKLFYDRDGVRTPIKRIYNRVIPDDLERHKRTWPFPTGADLDVEWIGGPDWFFRISKFSIPWFKHPWVPETHYLSDVTTLPQPREDWLLKPLYSFAGGGIMFAPTDEHLTGIPKEDRRHYVLQRKVTFTPVIDTPHGATQVELRIMMVRDGDEYRPVLPLARMGRGKMMGVDYNKGLAWVGATAALVDYTR